MAPSDEAMAIQLAETLEAGRVRDHHAARSLLRAWSSDEGWTPAQARLAARLLREAPLPAGEVRAIAPHTYRRGGAWWRDVRPERQALRGRKSGITRRWRTRDRDKRIRTLRRQGESLGKIASTVGMSRSGVVHVLKRKMSAPLPRLAAVRRTILRTPEAIIGSHSSRNCALFNGLIRWTGLRTVRLLSDNDVADEAHRLNRTLPKPLGDREVRKIVRSVCQRREKWDDRAGEKIPYRVESST